MTVFNEIGCKMLDFIAEIPYNYRVRYFIWRRIEVVITDMTRNIVGSVTHPSVKLRCLSAFTPCAFALLKTCISQFSRNLVIRLCLYNFIWRRIEVVITGLTRNQLGSNPPRVRISPSPPKLRNHTFGVVP